MQNYIKTILGTCLLILLVGCGTIEKQSREPIPVALIQKCLPIQPVEGTDGKAQIKAHTANAAIFWACSDKMDKLIEAVKSQK